MKKLYFGVIFCMLVLNVFSQSLKTTMDKVDGKRSMVCLADAGSVDVVVGDSISNTFMDVIAGDTIYYPGFNMCHFWSMDVDSIAGTSSAPSGYAYVYTIFDANTGAVVAQNTDGIFYIDETYVGNAVYLVTGISYDPLDPTCYDVSDSIIPFYVYPMLLVEPVPGSEILDSINCTYSIDVQVSGGCGGGYSIVTSDGNVTAISGSVFHISGLSTTDTSYIMEAYCHIGCLIEVPIAIPLVECPTMPVLYTEYIVDTITHSVTIHDSLISIPVIVTDTVVVSIPGSDTTFTDTTYAQSLLIEEDYSGVIEGSVDTVLTSDTILYIDTTFEVYTYLAGGVTIYDTLVVVHGYTYIVNIYEGIVVQAMQLTQYEVAVSPMSNNVRWHDMSWQSNASYILERSDDGILFQDVARFLATQSDYSFSDFGIQKTVYYRLKSIEPNGKIDLAHVLVAARSEDTELISLYNNLVSNELQIKHIESCISYEIMDLYGHTCMYANASNEIVDVTKLVSGIYIIRLERYDHTYEVFRFVKM